jgi:hypothetical protein
MLVGRKTNAKEKGEKDEVRKTVEIRKCTPE